MRRFIVSVTLILMIMVLLGGSMEAALAVARPFKPNSLVFPVQYIAEQSRAVIILDRSERAAYFLDLAEQRSRDLAALAGGKGERLALDSFNRSLDQVLDAIAIMPPSNNTNLVTRLVNLAQGAKEALDLLTITPREQPEAYSAMKAKVDSIIQLASGLGSPQTAFIPLDEIAALFPMVMKESNGTSSETDPSGLDPRAVEFPSGSLGAMHAFFPLIGQHATLSCATCHANGQYAGTPNQCESCHAEVKPANHFVGDCAACHSAFAWSDIHFDHSLAGTNDCQSCHAKDKPANHFSGQCSLCHNTSNWVNATFNHQAVGATDCQSCHFKDKPANHFSGQCSLCHNTSNWVNATFNHQAVGAIDCQSCHNRNKPANHFSGQCSLCHNTTNWINATFNHPAVGAIDCQSCHNKDKPANHFSGQCSQCHNTSSWKSATFNHQAVGATDCQSCHSKDKPANHFSGQCSQCHNTTNWANATFNHQAAGATDCQSCHGNDRPANHFSGQCSQCHNTSSWGDANFNHSFPMNHGGANGDCAKCHPKDTSKWTCYKCHDKTETETHHAEKNIIDIASRCLDCHNGGDSGGEGDD